MKYTEDQKRDIINEVCRQIAEEGTSLRKILSSSDMPNRNTFFEWIDADEEKANQYARAMEARAELIFEDILSISDANGDDIRFTDEGQYTDHDVIQRARLRVDARKWMLGKMNPKKYGDKLDVTSGNKPVSSNIAVTVHLPEDDD